MKILMRWKKVTVRTSGYIVPLAAKGPIKDPQRVNMDLIKRLVMEGYRVYEHLKDGRIVELNATNYDKENGDPADPSMETEYATVRRLGYHNDKNIVSIPPRKSVKDILRDSTKVVLRDTGKSTSTTTNVKSSQGTNVAANKTQINDNTKDDKKKDKHDKKHGEQFDMK